MPLRPGTRSSPSGDAPRQLCSALGPDTQTEEPAVPANPLNTDGFGVELYNLGMSDAARPLLDQVKAFVADEVEPITAEFFRLGEERDERWSYAPGQLE